MLYLDLGITSAGAMLGFSKNSAFRSVTANNELNANPATTVVFALPVRSASFAIENLAANVKLVNKELSIITCPARSIRFLLWTPTNPTPSL